MSKKEIEIKTWVSREAMVKHLQDLAACLAQGRIVLERGGEYLEFTPGQSMELELEGAHKKGQQKISIEMIWRQVVAEPYDEPLKISPEAPPAPPVIAASPEEAPEAAAVAVEPVSEVKEEAAKGKGSKTSGK